ncbi:hypothetical protein [Paracoccus tibetensis]|uniref:hypothetical protein n=1 Tax=Paracoccus tibetensis TaxID=336292 RepID=UPI001114632B|nr:hypothetical protein [Paracoccus tibetensis]
MKMRVFSMRCHFSQMLPDFSACAPERRGLNTASPKAGTLEGPGRGALRSAGLDRKRFWEWMTGLGVERLALDPRFCFLCFLTLMDI